LAKYSVEHSCGHTETVQLVGKHKDRERRIEWLENHAVCSECYATKRDAERTAANAAAAQANAAAALPELTGSEKQIAWAESIRKPVCDVLRDARAQLLEKLRAEFSPAAQQELADALTLLVSERIDRTSASEWIDGRFEFQRDHVLHVQQKLIHEAKSRGLCPTLFAEQAAAEGGAE
jgi:hypothetical protein